MFILGEIRPFIYGREPNCRFLAPCLQFGEGKRKFGLRLNRFLLHNSRLPFGADAGAMIDFRSMVNLVRPHPELTRQSNSFLPLLNKTDSAKTDNACFLMKTLSIR